MFPSSLLSCLPLSPSGHPEWPSYIKHAARPEGGLFDVCKDGSYQNMGQGVSWLLSCQNLNILNMASESLNLTV